MQTKIERIEAVNVKIVRLMLDRARAKRHGMRAHECAINEQMDKLESEIKVIRDE